MKGPFKFGAPLLFRLPMWVNLPSDSEVSLLLKPLTYSDITAFYDTYYITQCSDKFLNPSTHHTILHDAVVDYKNIINFPDITTLLQQLPIKDIQYLYECLMELSSISKEQLEELNMMLDIQFNPVFGDESWNCTVCQAKKLDYSRACGFLPEAERDPAPYLPRVGERRFTQCPISTLDGHVSSQASLAHTLLISGVLPEVGGLGEQTEWFVRVALLYKRKVAEAERAQIEASKQKR